VRDEYGCMGFYGTWLVDDAAPPSMPVQQEGAQGAETWHAIIKIKVI